MKNMYQKKPVSLRALAEILLSSASKIDIVDKSICNDKQPCKIVINCVKKIADLYKKDPSIKENFYLKPIIKELQHVNNINNPKEIARALKLLTMPPAKVEKLRTLKTLNN